MANTVPSPNMSMPVPVVSVTPEPDWATDINASLSIVDSHNHSAGQGVAINPSGMLINTDLAFGSNNATALRSVRFTSQGAPLSAGADIGCLYESVADLYYNDSSGNQIRITQNGALAGAAGTITGLPSGTASAAFTSVGGGRFTFLAATSTPANLTIGPITLGLNSAGTKTITISPNGAQAANYNIIFPAALPGAANYVTLDSSGNISYNSSGNTGTGAVVLAASPTLSGTVGGSLSFSGLLQQTAGAQTTASINSATTNTTLTINSNPHQIFNNLNGSINVLLPTTGVLAGDTWVLDIALPSTLSSTIIPQASDGTSFSVTGGDGMNTEIGCTAHQPVGRAVFRAKINTPVTHTDWQVVEIQDSYKWTGTTTGSNIEAFTASMIRRNNVVTVQARCAAGTTTGTSPTIIGSAPSRILPTVAVWTGCVVILNGVAVNGMVQVTNNGSNEFNFWPYPTTWSGNCAIGGPDSTGTTTGATPASTSFTYDMYNVY